MQSTFLSSKKRATSVALYCSSSDFGAPTGHTPLHVPHEIQTFGSISYAASPSFIHVIGHDAAHAPHLIHCSLI